MQSDLAPADMPKSFAESEEKETAEQDCGCCLIHAANRLHGEAHQQGREPDDQTANYKEVAADAVPGQMTGAKGGTELQRSQDHEQQSWNDVNYGENGMPGEYCIEGGELSSAGIGRGSGCGVTVEQYRGKVHDAAHGNRDTDD
jgi:hypothetical protein